MIQRFHALVNARGSATAVIEAGTGGITTREQLLSRAIALGERLACAGVAAGDAVAIQLPNSVDFVATVIAALRGGMVIVPIDRDAPETEVASILAHFAVRALVYRSTGRADARPDSEATAISTRDVHGRLPLPPGTALVKLTSGSTSRPKGIVTTAANLIADCENICSSMQIGPDDINLGTIPFSHSYGFSNLVTPLLVQGTPLVATNDYLPQSLIETANRYGCTVAPLIPMVFEHLSTSAHGRFRTVRTFISAGAPLRATTSARFRERFGIDIHTFYGCSECGGITYDREGAAVERGTVGRALDGVTLSASARRLEVRSASVAAGYLLDHSTFVPIAGGAFQTDDLVEARGEEIALVGRASDLINTAGKKVNPREVEAVILQIDGVRDVRVYGEHAGARGEVVAAAVVATPEVTRESVRAFCRARLSPHKVPRIVKLVEQMPVDDRGKVRRAALEAL